MEKIRRSSSSSVTCALPKIWMFQLWRAACAVIWKSPLKLKWAGLTVILLLKLGGEVLEYHGVAVFKDAFGNDFFSGFCMYDETFPVIYVNNTSSRTRQIFTLFHELAHLLFNTSGIDTSSYEPDEGLSRLGRQIEVICNRFAAEFLLPTSRFKEDISGLDPSEETAKLLANRYHVSPESIFRRFLDSDLITADEYRQFAQRSEGEYSGKGGGNYYWTKITYLGTNYIDLAFSKYHQNRISEPELADYLDMKVKNLPRLESYFFRETPLMYVFDNSPLSQLFNSYYRSRLSDSVGVCLTNWLKTAWLLPRGKLPGR